MSAMICIPGGLGSVEIPSEFGYGCQYGHRVSALAVRRTANARLNHPSPKQRTKTPANRPGREGVGYAQFHTDMSPAGYWLQTSVDLATTPLLLKKIFMWLRQPHHSGSMES